MSDIIKPKDMSIHQVRIYASTRGEELFSEINETSAAIGDLADIVFRDGNVAGQIFAAGDQMAARERHPTNLMNALRNNPREIGHVRGGFFGGPTRESIEDNCEFLACYLQKYTDQQIILAKYQDLEQRAHEVSQMPEDQRAEGLAELRRDVDYIDAMYVVRMRDADRAISERTAEVHPAAQLSRPLPPERETGRTTAAPSDWLAREIEQGKRQLESEMTGPSHDREPERDRDR